MPGLLFLLVFSLPAMVINKNHRDEVHEEWLLMEKQLADPTLPKYHTHLVQIIEIEKEGKLLKIGVEEKE